MERQYQVASAVRRALVMGALTAAGAAPALAQENLGEIVVTGSRIRQANLESTTPVTQVTAADVVTQGVARIEDLVNQLPQAFASQNVTVANGAEGTATLNLRGLGSPRTLVLVDGRRLPYGSAFNSAADINQIPTQMIERVDILTGGASAVYGSDAVAGVVNFIMKKDFEGVQVTSQYNTYWHENDFKGPGETKLRDTIASRAETSPDQFALPDDTVTDGEGKELSLLVGVNSGDGRGNITAYATVFDSDAVLQRDRDYSACSLNPAVLGDGTPAPSFTCGGSSTNSTGRFTNFEPSTIPDPADPDCLADTSSDDCARLANPVFFNQTTNDANSWRAFNSASDLYNFGPLNHYQRPERRYSIGAMGHYEFGEHADVYTQLMFNDYESIAQIAPSGNFFETNTINCDNPLLPAGVLPLLTNGVYDDNGFLIGQRSCDPNSPDFVGPGESITMYIGRRNVEGGGRQQSFANDTFRAIAGVRGSINEAWGYDVSAQYSQGTGTTATLNYYVTPRVARALNVIDVGGVPTCQSVIDGTDPACVPWNPFVPGGISQEQLDYLQAPGLQIGRINQEIYNAVVNGDLGVYGVKTPWASDGIQVVFGTEWRRDTVKNTVDALQELGQLGGSGGPTIGISGGTQVEELFMEARVPIAQDRSGMESLSFDTAYRYSDYGDGVQTDTYKFGLEWAPVQDVRVRGSYQRAVRAANIIELFTAQGFNLFDAPGDPCGAQARDAVNATAAECIATGVPSGAVGSSTLDSPAGQYSFLQGGDPSLQPETSDTYSYGIVFTPRFAPGLAVTIDYFDIKVEDTITNLGGTTIWQACYAAEDQTACGLINRNPGTGQLWVGTGHVVDLNRNIGTKSTKGYDLNASYTGLEIGRFGSLAFNLTGTLLDELITQPFPGLDLNTDAANPGVQDSYDCAGFYSTVCSGVNTGAVNPEWRHRLRTSWQTPWDLDLSLTWRYYDKVIGVDGPNEEMQAGQLDRVLPAESYFDLAANWAITEKASVALGINNVLDDNPSISGQVGTTGNGNTFPQTYDALGRYVFVRATVDF